MSDFNLKKLVFETVDSVSDQGDIKNIRDAAEQKLLCEHGRSCKWPEGGFTGAFLIEALTKLDSSYAYISPKLRCLDYKIYLDELAWLEALKMVMSEIPDIDTPVDVMMNHEIEKLPDGFVVWEPFENFDLMGIQGLVEEFRNSFLAHSTQVLKLAGVDNA